MASVAPSTPRCCSPTGAPGPSARGAGAAAHADRLSALYHELLDLYYGGSVAKDDLYGLTWARIPHFFRSPFYVYQYATCYAASAKILGDMRRGSAAERQAVVDRYLDLLRAGGSDHPMDLLRRAGVDLSQSASIRAVVDQLDTLVSQLEQSLDDLGTRDGRQ